MNFFVECTPVGKQRPRVVRGHAFTPQKTRDCEAKIRSEFLSVCGLPPGTELPLFPKPGAVEVEVVAYLPIPKSWPKSKRDLAAWEALPHTSRPDIDNLSKTVLDALNEVAWEDDSQIARLAASKTYTDGKTGFFVEIKPYMED